MIVALQVFNLSINVDYLASANKRLQSNVHYNGVDSLTDYFLEKITEDHNYIPEDNDASGAPAENGMEKYQTGPLYFEQVTHHHVAYHANPGSHGMTGMELSNKISKGYFSIISPPPKS